VKSVKVHKVMKPNKEKTPKKMPSRRPKPSVTGGGAIWRIKRSTESSEPHGGLVKTEILTKGTDWVTPKGSLKN